MARLEENIFRRGIHTWGKMIQKSIIFGLMHLIIGIPLGAGRRRRQRATTKKSKKRSRTRQYNVPHAYEHNLHRLFDDNLHHQHLKTNRPEKSGFLQKLNRCES